MEEAWGFTWTAQMGQVASDASDFRGDLTQWLSMQGPPQAQESPTLKATAGTTDAALASIMGTHYGFTKQVALLHLLKHRGWTPLPLSCSE